MLKNTHAPNNLKHECIQLNTHTSSYNFPKLRVNTKQLKPIIKNNETKIKHLSFINKSETSCRGWTFHPTLDLPLQILTTSHP
jgi:hypothetical protein